MPGATCPEIRTFGSGLRANHDPRKPRKSSSAYRDDFWQAVAITWWTVSYPQSKKQVKFALWEEKG